MVTGFYKKHQIIFKKDLAAINSLLSLHPRKQKNSSLKWETVWQEWFFEFRFKEKINKIPEKIFGRMKYTHTFATPAKRE